MKRDARLAILEAGAELVHRKGFHNTGIKEILDLAEVPKGSFYFYFPSKEAFGLALIDHFRDSRAPIIDQILSDPSRPPLERLSRFLAGARERFAGWGCERGCPFGNLAQELSDLSPAMREALRASLDGLSRRIGRVLAEAAEQDELPEGLDPDELAAFIMDAWEGAILRMKAEKSVQPLLRFEKLLFARVLNTPRGGGQREQATPTG